MQSDKTDFVGTLLDPSVAVGHTEILCFEF